MKTEKILNSEGKPYISKENKELVKNIFSDGDLFVPKYNNYKTSKKNVLIDNKETTIETYTLLCSELYDIETKQTIKDVFVELTPTQANTISKCIVDGIDINQHNWNAYSYTNDRGSWVGIGIKKEYKEPVKIQI